MSACRTIVPSPFRAFEHSTFRRQGCTAPSSTKQVPMKHHKRVRNTTACIAKWSSAVDSHWSTNRSKPAFASPCLGFLACVQARCAAIWWKRSWAEHALRIYAQGPQRNTWMTFVAGSCYVAEFEHGPRSDSNNLEYTIHRTDQTHTQCMLWSTNNNVVPHVVQFIEPCCYPTISRIHLAGLSYLLCALLRCGAHAKTARHIWRRRCARGKSWPRFPSSRDCQVWR